jgi:hypothetical protein
MAIEEKSRLSRSFTKITLVEEEVEGCSEEEEKVITDNISTRLLLNVLSVTD